MSWYFIQSLLFVLLAFALGLLVGYLLWRLQYRKVRRSVGFVDGEESSRPQHQGSSRPGSLRGDFDALNTRYEASVSDRNTQAKAYSALQFEHGGLKAAVGERDGEIAEFTAELSKLKADLADRSAELRSAKAEASDLRATRATPNTQNIPNTQNAPAKQGAGGNAVAELEQRHQKSLADVRAERDKVAAELRSQHERMLTDVRSERDRVISGMRAEQEKAIADHRRRSESAESELTAARASGTSLQADLAKLRAEHAAQAERLKAAIELRNEAQTRLAGHEKLIAEQTQRIESLASVSSPGSVSVGNAAEVAGGSAALASAQADLDAQATQLATAAREVESLRSQLRASQAEVSTVGDEHAKSLQALTDAATGRDRVLAEREASVQALRREVRRVEDELAGVRKSSEAADADRNQLLAERDWARGEVGGLKNEREALVQELETERAKVGVAVGERDTARAEHENDKGEFEQARRSLTDVGRTHEGRQRELDTAKVEHEALRQELVRARQDLAGARDEIEGSRSRVSRVEAERSQIEAARVSAETQRDKERAEHSREVAALRSEHGRALNIRDESLGSVREELDATKAESAESRARHVSAGNEIENLRAQLGDVHGELDVTKAQQQARIAELRAEQERALRQRELALSTAHTQAVAAVESQVSRHQNDLASLRELHNQLRSAHESSVGELMKMRVDHDRLLGDLAKARSRAVDDLERIEGVGPAFNRALQASGLRTFESVRNANDATLRAAIERAGLKFAPSLPTWSRQAGYLAADDTEGFASFTRYLIAGQDPSSWSGAELVDGEITPAFSARGVASVPGGADTGGSAGSDESQAKGGRDDLQRIEGIGPRIDQALQNSGINTYRDLSRASDQRLRAALEAGGLSFAPSLTTWAEQATLLARGDDEGFAALTARLIAGRRESK